MLNYDFANGFSVGLGCRYWNLGSGNGDLFAHFEENTNFPPSIIIGAHRAMGRLLPGQLQILRSTVLEWEQTRSILVRQHRKVNERW